MEATIVSMHQAQASLPQLVERVAGGEVIFISSNGRTEAVLAAAIHARPKKRLGLLEGKLTLPDDFDDPLPPEILAAFEGDTE